MERILLPVHTINTIMQTITNSQEIELNKSSNAAGEAQKECCAVIPQSVQRHTC